MSAVAFGRFTLLDLRGAAVGTVIVAPECILLQRGPAAPVRDVSYLALWTDDRIAAVAKELATIARRESAIVDSRTPELHAILHAIAPTALPVLAGAGRCGRRFARIKLKAELLREAPRTRQTTAVR